MYRVHDFISWFYFPPVITGYMANNMSPEKLLLLLLSLKLLYIIGLSIERKISERKTHLTRL